jgi:S-DNA-T family DNA segregation ATPase FtsK/SpoIIIE
LAQTKKTSNNSNNKSAAKSAPRKSSAKGGTKSAAKKPSEKELQESREAAFRERRRFWSLILFFFGIFEIILTFVKGDGLWKILYDFNRGMLGASVFLFGIFIIYLALTIASEKSKSAVISRALQGIVMIFLLSGAAQIFFGRRIEGASFWLKLRGLYIDGTTLHGGGVAGAVFGWSLLSLFKKTGAAIIIVMLIALFALLLSNITLPQLLKALSRPFVGGAKAIAEDRAERAAEREYAELYELSQENEKYGQYPQTEEPVQPVSERTSRREKNERKKKKRQVDLARLYQLQEAKAEKLRQEEALAAERAESLNEMKPDVIIEYDEEDEESATAQPQKIVMQTTDGTAAVAASEVKSETAETAEKEQKSSKKKSSKPPSRAEQVAEEKQRLAEQIKLDELIKKASTTANQPTQSTETGFAAIENDGESQAYVYPPVELLKETVRTSSEEEIQREIQEKSRKLVDTLETFGVKTRIVGIHRGPSVTRYELQPAAGVKVKAVTSLADDIALNLAADSVRIEAPIPGKPAIGIEIPNIHRDSVSMRELIDSDNYRRAKGKLSFAVGKDIEGKIVIGDISAMPHMLIAGTTGSGKSVFTNSIILNILFHASPDEVKLILIDPKKVEFPMYNGIPHLLIPVVTEPLKAAGALGWAVNEMMRRYNLFEANGTKNLEDYNDMVEEMQALDPECTRTKLTQIVIVVDEFADLMMAAKNEVEESVLRLAQLARAAGMHMLIATQSPRVDVLTGLIKANIPSRTALMVSNNTDSRVILDEIGAEKLLGKGDMLYKPAGVSKPMRIQSGFASTQEIRDVVSFLKNEHGADYSQEIIHEVEQNMPKPKNEEDTEITINPDDDLVNQAITIIVETGNASTAFLQRKLKLGFPRAARIMDDIEAMGIIGPQEGAKPRKINITKEEWYERQARS